MKNKKNLILSIGIIVFTGIIYICYNSLKISGKMNYSGANDIASIKISRFTDYDEFLRAKPSSIIIYNEHNELRNNINSFMVGEVGFNYDFYRKDAEYKLECIKKSGGSFSASLISTGEVSEGNTLNIPFIAYDFDNSINGTLKKVIITMDGREITTLKLKKL